MNAGEKQRKSETVREREREEGNQSVCQCEVSALKAGDYSTWWQ